MEVDTEILEPLVIEYSDLVILSSSRVSTDFSLEEREKLDSLSKAVMENLGPSGTGLLSITGIPKASNLRRKLLPLARKLALLNHEDRRRILRDHGLGSDVPLKHPERAVSSFALQLKCDLKPNLDSSSHVDSVSCISTCVTKMCVINSGEYPDTHTRDTLDDDEEFSMLGYIFRNLGFCMMDMGLHLARVCDKAIGGQELEKAILESLTAKGRLIHYHSVLENLILKESGKRTKRSSRNFGRPISPPCGTLVSQKERVLECSEMNSDESRRCKTSLSNLWQQWHYDYGIFTILTSPLFMRLHQSELEVENHLSISKDDSLPDGVHICLQVLDTNRNKVRLIYADPDSFIVQVGESAEILSKGKLRATLHSVSRPKKQQELSRETFVLFLQPAWNKVFSLPECDRGETSSLDSFDGEIQSTSDSKSVNGELSHAIQRMIPPLSSRVKNGMTFAEFSRETTKQYYGVSGVQSNRQ